LDGGDVEELVGGPVGPPVGADVDPTLIVLISVKRFTVCGSAGARSGYTVKTRCIYPPYGSRASEKNRRALIDPLATLRVRNETSEILALAHIHV
jgi:hypothetical protein